MVIYEYKPTATVSGAAWTDDTLKINAGICYQVVVKSSNPETTFDFKMTNQYGVDIREFEDCVGHINDVTPIPVKGIVTFAINNASKDESFTVYASFVMET